MWMRILKRLKQRKIVSVNQMYSHFCKRLKKKEFSFLSFGLIMMVVVVMLVAEGFVVILVTAVGVMDVVLKFGMEALLKQIDAN